MPSLVAKTLTPSRGARTLYDPEAGDEAVALRDISGRREPLEPPRTNCFTVAYLKAGCGAFWADAASHRFASPALLFFTPYQHIRFEPATTIAGTSVLFHANFLCVETFHAESGCAGRLFNDPWQPPIIPLDDAQHDDVRALFDAMQAEQAGRSLGYEEMLLARLKILLILATRWKTSSADACAASPGTPRHPALSELKELIEQHYCTLHAPSDYAARLHMPAKTLGRIVREQLGKSLTDLIRERILTHAKWQLLHTLKPVKEVAREVGFTDELYFSRMFKKATGFSPTFFREFETRIRGGSNLSMLSPPAPILTSRPSADTSVR
jgi:AraC-like DNA-binding protein